MLLYTAVRKKPNMKNPTKQKNKTKKSNKAEKVKHHMKERRGLQLCLRGRSQYGYWNRVEKWEEYETAEHPSLKDLLPSLMPRNTANALARQWSHARHIPSANFWAKISRAAGSINVLPWLQHAAWAAWPQAQNWELVAQINSCHLSGEPHTGFKTRTPWQGSLLTQKLP